MKKATSKLKSTVRFRAGDWQFIGRIRALTNSNGRIVKGCAYKVWRSLESRNRFLVSYSYEHIEDAFLEIWRDRHEVYSVWLDGKNKMHRDNKQTIRAHYGIGCVAIGCEMFTKQSVNALLDAESKLGDYEFKDVE